jgi:hypothetical protein
MKRRDALVGAGSLALTAAGASLFELRRMGSMEEYNASVLATRGMLAARPDMRAGYDGRAVAVAVDRIS